MKRRKKIIIAFIIFVVAVMAILVVLLLKRPQDVKKLRALSGASAFDFINTDLAEGKIKPEDALLYKIYGVFGDERLPEKYKVGEVPFEGAGVFFELKRIYDGLSEEVKGNLFPYLARPDAPDSVIDYELGANHHGLISDVFAAERPPAKEKRFSYKFKESSDGKFKIWYPDNDIIASGKTIKTEDSEKTAKKIADKLASAGVFKKFEDLLKVGPISDGSIGGDGKIDIYIAYGIKSHGLTITDTGKKSEFILINPIQSETYDSALHGTIAHEIFHIFQTPFNTEYDDAKDKWWMEATATWAEHFIYPKGNSEQEFLENFIEAPEKKLTKTDGGFEYGAYLFPFFLEQNYGADMIQKVFKGRDLVFAVTKSIDDFVPGGFKDNWKKFTEWNYNLSPAKFYKDPGGFPQKSAFSSRLSQTIYLSDAGPAEVEIGALEPLSSVFAAVYADSLDRKKTQGVEFSGLENFWMQSERAAIKAIIYLRNGGEYIEDWTEKSGRTFCFNKNKEDIDQVILIFSNASLDAKTGKMKISAAPKEECEKKPSDDFVINQVDNVKGVYIGSSADFYGQKVYPTSRVMVKTVGKMLEKTKLKVFDKYPYIGKWRVNYDLTETINDYEFTVVEQLCRHSGGGFKYKGVFEFDLEQAIANTEGGTKDGLFTVGTISGAAEKYGGPSIVRCENDEDDIWDHDPLSKEYGESIYRGYMFEMTDEGAKIIFPISFIYGTNNWRKLDPPITLIIKSE